ncbi:MAG: 23S rRNA (pseudouridine(1915)-N(3))-methyltransferase RlmH [Pseudomonadota bacterium]
MKVRIVAVGRLRPGAEAELIAEYTTRFDRTGRGLGLGPLDIREVEARKSDPATEAPLIEKARQGTDILVTLDERGKTLSSPDFAQRLADWRDQGRREICFIIGGASGLTPALRAEADLSLSFGKLVWPHMLARVMLCEQLYRAASILAGGPYHRE